MKKFIIKHKTDSSIIGTLNTKKQASDFVVKLVELNKLDNVFDVVCEEQDIDDYPPQTFSKSQSKEIDCEQRRYEEESTVKMFDENTLKPFDKVLARDFLNDNWMADFFEKIEENDIYYNVTCVTCKWVQCIPYNEDTKHLLGTTNDCPEYYKWWEE